MALGVNQNVAPDLSIALEYAEMADHRIVPDNRSRAHDHMMADEAILPNPTPFLYYCGRLNFASFSNNDRTMDVRTTI
jgi:hypothetical protein